MDGWSEADGTAADEGVGVVDVVAGIHLLLERRRE